MKKILLFILLLGLPCYAVEGTAPRAFVEITNYCYPKITVGTTPYDVFRCLRDGFSNPYYFRSGWTTSTKGNVFNFLLKTPLPPNAKGNEKAVGEMMQYSMAGYFNHIINSAKRDGLPATPLTSDNLKEFKDNF